MPKKLGHGSYHIQVDHRVLISESYGSWNDITIKHFIDEYKLKATPLLNKAWAAIVDVSQWKLATQEAETIAKDFELWCKNNNRAHIAIVGSNSMINFQLNRSGLDDNESHIAIDHFSSQEKALDWLAQFGYLSTKRHCHQHQS